MTARLPPGKSGGKPREPGSNVVTPKARRRRAPTVRRADYAQAWLVPRIELDFDLDPERVRVRARLDVVRGGAHREPLRLDGEGLTLVSLRVDGKAASHKLDRSSLTVRLASDAARIDTVVEVAPATAQQGLFRQGGLLCTQCEPEWFRRITFFPDRPDVLARYRVRMTADKARFPILLANGNSAGSGDLEGGRHWADGPPFRSRAISSPGRRQVEAARDSFTPYRKGGALASARRVRSGRHGHAMDRYCGDGWASRFCREYELAAYNIVASWFEPGAMENKGWQLRGMPPAHRPDTATDSDLEGAAAWSRTNIHNWSGNRVPASTGSARINEGLTVFRASSSARPARGAGGQRNRGFRALRAAQFAGTRGRGPSRRPDSYRDPRELATRRLCQGAELVR